MEILKGEGLEGIKNKMIDVSKLVTEFPLHFYFLCVCHDVHPKLFYTAAVCVCARVSACLCVWSCTFWIIWYNCSSSIISWCFPRQLCQYWIFLLLLDVFSIRCGYWDSAQSTLSVQFCLWCLNIVQKCLFSAYLPTIHTVTLSFIYSPFILHVMDLLHW